MAQIMKQTSEELSPTSQTESSLLAVYKRSGLSFEKGKGCYLYTYDNEAYLDFAAGIAVNSLGHCHPELVNSIKEQAEKYWHISNGHIIPEQEELAAFITQTTFADKCFITNSGAEAIECAIKAARRYFYGQRKEQFEIICCNNAFHGRSMTGITASGQQKMIEGFAPLMPGFKHIPFNDIEALRQSITPQTAAIMFEPIQGEGGIKAISKEFIEAAATLAEEKDLLLIFDEIQCGAGRTGKLFAYEHYGIEPDIMTIAKGMGGGIPVGACIMTNKVAHYMPIGSHGSTYGGNPLVSKVSLTALQLIHQPDFLKHVDQVGAYLKTKLHALINEFPKLLKSVRGMGLMIGLQANEVKNLELIKAFRDEKLLTVGGGDNIIRLLPPLIVTEKECDKAAEKIRAACQKLERA